LILRVSARVNQVVLGSYISTYIYCLIVLNAIKENDQLLFVPSISIMFAQVAALANIILLIVFIHHIAIGIQADRVIADISEDLSKNIRTLFPESYEAPKEDQTEDQRESPTRDYRDRQVKREVKAGSSGYLQYVDMGSLIDLATREDLVIEVLFRPGDYLVLGHDVAVVYSGETVDDQDLDHIWSHFIVGKSRTRQQDAEHSIHQLVEIAARALSPGVNDPYTAISCIDNLTSILSYVTTVKFPSKHLYDDEGHLRVIADTLTFEGMLDAAFNQIRQYATGNPAVVIRMMESLVALHEFTWRSDQLKAIERHARMVMNMAEEAFSERNDLEDLKERSKQILTGEGPAANS
jgi:uncharacterized membrane protein